MDDEKDFKELELTLGEIARPRLEREVMEDEIEALKMEGARAVMEMVREMEREGKIKYVEDGEEGEEEEKDDDDAQEEGWKRWFWRR